MAASRLEVDGKIFFSRTEYEGALRDSEKIREIKKTYDLENPEDVKEVYAYLSGGSYRFESVIGDEFDNEIYHLYEDIKNGRTNVHQKTSSQKNKGKNKKLKQSFSECDEELKEAVRKELKSRERKRAIVIGICSLVALFCFGYFVIYYLQSYRLLNDSKQLAEIKEQNRTPGLAYESEYDFSDEEEKDKVLEVLEDYKTLLNMNNDLIGWLKIADINIDYPVMQTNDNSYYLEHNFEKKSDKNGCLFLDYQCDVINRNTNLIIYGHNMQSGNMFGNLDKYSSEEYYLKHPKFEFDTIYEKGAYEIVYVFRSKIYNEDTVVFKYYQFLDAQSELEFDSNMAEMAELSLYDTGITPKYGDELLTLSTCDYQENNGRFVIVARKIK